MVSNYTITSGFDTFVGHTPLETNLTNFRSQQTVLLGKMPSQWELIGNFSFTPDIIDMNWASQSSDTSFFCYVS